MHNDRPWQPGILRKNARFKWAHLSISIDFGSADYKYHFILVSLHDLPEGIPGDLRGKDGTRSNRLLHSFLFSILSNTIKTIRQHSLYYTSLRSRRKKKTYLLVMVGWCLAHNGIVLDASRLKLWATLEAEGEREMIEKVDRLRMTYQAVTWTRAGK